MRWPWSTTAPTTRTGSIDVVRSKAGISTLHEVTGGDPRRTARWQANMAMGGDQELTARLRTKQGETWGALEPLPGTRRRTVRRR